MVNDYQLITRGCKIHLGSDCDNQNWLLDFRKSDCQCQENPVHWKLQNLLQTQIKHIQSQLQVEHQQMDITKSSTLPLEVDICDDLKTTKSCKKGRKIGKCEDSPSFANKCKMTCNMC